MKKINFAPVLLTFFFLSLPYSAYANKAGLVVRKSTGEIKTACVEFSQAFISGEDLLEMSGLNPVFENKFLIEIDGERSKGYENLADDDSYWSYWIYDSVWKYANSGATYTKVYDKAIHGWQFAQSELSIPSIHFDDICVQDVIAQESVIVPKETGDTANTPRASNPANPTNNSRSDQISVSSETTKPNIVFDNSATQNLKNQPANILNLSVSKLPTQDIFKFSLKNVLFVICGFFILGLALFGGKLLMHRYKRSHFK